MSEFGGLSSLIFTVIGSISIYINNKMYMGYIVSVLYSAKIYTQQIEAQGNNDDDQ